MDGSIKHSICFDKEIYRQEAIIKAIADFKEVTDLSYADEERLCICTFRNSQVPIDTLMNEFSNYVLDITVKMGNNNVD